MERVNLLVSVRSVQEAETALIGGADLIDVKEPSRGPLGAADTDVIEAIVAAVAGRIPVSAAMGEFRARPPTRMLGGLAFVKFGLSGVSNDEAAAVAAELLRTTENNAGTEPRRRPKRSEDSAWPRHDRSPRFASASAEPIEAAPVLVAYADHLRACSPDPEQLVDLACKLRFPAFLIDTFEKDGRGLLDWIDRERLERMRKLLFAADVKVALAGSLDADSIRDLLPLRPDWFAVRGAACTGGRLGMICPDRIRRLRGIIGEG